ncbi:MAG: M1 family metallopeptidase [Bacteroidota bacterium]|nr:M1 family metallopeptidase [Bacteroidota bacterium]
MKFHLHYFLFLFILITTNKIFAQNKSIDVLHYRFEISLNDTNNNIEGKAGIIFLIKKPTSLVSLDLTSINETTGKGMKVSSIEEGNKKLKFIQEHDIINIYFDESLSINIQKNISISYAGVPADGLIIDKNKFKQRTFFADNWPNRAHNWIPCNDHPSDKATVDFIVTAPDHYEVIANGILVEESNLPNHLKLSHWKEDIVLPTKIMVIGVADFAIQLAANINCIPITSWVFPENKDSGFAQYSISKNILPFYTNYIGPYPFKKLANVQSKTIFGGMENAGNIFYYENSVAMNDAALKHNRPLEDLFAHETAHQWFGDEVSEIDWPHVWLSEGFATYMTDLYMEKKYGADTLQARMKRDRQKILKFYEVRKTPVVDTTSADSLMKLLNANSYEKGSWVLHMLRRKIGDILFKKGIQSYYAAYKGRNASTDDFMKVMEKISKKNLQIFFKQWLYNPGQPVIAGSWKYDAGKKVIVFSIKQIQDLLFDFPLEISIRSDKQSVLKTINIHNKISDVTAPVNFKPLEIILDPNVNLLFDGNIEKEK